MKKMKYLTFFALCALSLCAIAVAQEAQVADMIVPEDRDGWEETRGEGESEDIKIFKCSRAKGTYATLLEGLFSVSIPSRVVITYDCHFLIVPSVTRFPVSARKSELINSTLEEDDISERGFSVVSFNCELYPDFYSKNHYICGKASQKSSNGARYYGRNFGVNAVDGLLQFDAGSCTVHSDDKIKCFFYMFDSNADGTYLYSSVMEKVSDDIDDDILSDLNNPKWSYSACEKFPCSDPPPPPPPP